MRTSRQIYLLESSNDQGIGAGNRLSSDGGAERIRPGHRSGYFRLRGEGAIAAETQPVLMVTANNEHGAIGRTFTGVVQARYESDHAFRTDGKVGPGWSKSARPSLPDRHPPALILPITTLLYGQPITARLFSKETGDWLQILKAGIRSVPVVALPCPYVMTPSPCWVNAQRPAYTLNSAIV